MASDVSKDKTISAAAETPIRYDMVDTAVRFMQNPKVKQTSADQQREFLRKKGLTDPEIENAMSRVSQSTHGTSTGGPNQNLNFTGEQSAGIMGMGGVYYPPPQRTTWKDYANVAVIMGGASYGAYRIARRWILPNLFGVPDPEVEQMRRVEENVNELQNNIRFVMDSVRQTLTAVQSQQDSLQRALLILADNKERSGGVTSNQINELKAEFGVIKSLLLSRSQFAPLPNESKTVPSWQLNGGSPSAKHTQHQPHGQVTAFTNGFHSSDSVSSINSQNGYTTPREMHTFDEEDDGTKGFLKQQRKEKADLEKEDLDYTDEEDTFAEEEVSTPV